LTRGCWFSRWDAAFYSAYRRQTVLHFAAQNFSPGCSLFTSVNGLHMSRIDAIASAIAAEVELLSISRADSIMIALSYSRLVDIPDWKSRRKKMDREREKSKEKKRKPRAIVDKFLSETGYVTFYKLYVSRCLTDK